MPSKEIPLYGDIDSEEEAPKSIPRVKEGTPPSFDSRYGESKSPDGGGATSEGEPGEDYSGLALTHLGSTSTPGKTRYLNTIDDVLQSFA
jgi:hypothetical protein